jgi:cell division protein FtsW
MAAFARSDNSVLGRWWWTVDRWLFFSVISLIVVGFFLTLAASPSVAERLHYDSFYFVKRHSVYLAAVLVTLIGVSLLSLQNIRRLSLGVYCMGLVLLFMTLFWGAEVKGARRWVSLLGFSMQPSEFIKPALVVLCAWMLSEKKINSDFPGNLITLFFYAGVMVFLLLQPDMGMVILITTVLFGQFFLAGLPLLWVVVAGGAGVAGLTLAYFIFPHVHQRIDRFFNPSLGDKYSEKYQITQSLDAFINGGFWGQGPGEGTVKKNLPDAHADFIFAVAAEEFGFILCLGILGLFSFIVIRSIIRVLQEENFFIVLSVSGLVIEFGLQAMINIASTMNLIPTKGMTLPFISYGGSSLIALSLTMGMVLALTRRRVKGLWER